MVGKEHKNHNGKYYFFECECGKDTNYGISRYIKDYDYCIESCCGGGCVVAEGVKYCPFCGKKLEVNK